MAVLGLTKLDAVNISLRAGGFGRVSALDTGGASEAAIAEDVLDEISQQVQTEGLEENTVKCKLHTLDGNGKFTLDSSTLRIIPAGKDAHRQLVIRGDDVYDADNDTDVLGTPTTGTVQLTVIKELSFEDLSPASKKFIARLAAVEFQRRATSSPEKDAVLAQEASRAEAVVGKYIPPVNTVRPVNTLANPAVAAGYTESPFAGGQRGGG